MNAPDDDAGAAPERLTIIVGPRRFGSGRDIAVASAFALGLVAMVAVALVAGLPGVLGTVYVLTALAAWLQGFRRCWRIDDQRIEARRWFRWHVVDRCDVSLIEAARDEMGVRAVAVAGNGVPLEIDVDDVRVEPALAAALARFIDGCDHDGATIDPVVPAIVQR